METTDFGLVNLMLKLYFLESNAQRKYQTEQINGRTVCKIPRSIHVTN
jgi:hypothetical protein